MINLRFLLSFWCCLLIVSPSTAIANYASKIFDAKSLSACPTDKKLPQCKDIFQVPVKDKLNFTLTPPKVNVSTVNLHCNHASKGQCEALSAGDHYFLNGNLSGDIKFARGVRLFFRNVLTLSDVMVNEKHAPGDLVVYVGNRIIVPRSSEVTGFIYVLGSMTARTLKKLEVVGGIAFGSALSKEAQRILADNIEPEQRWKLNELIDKTDFSCMCQNSFTPESESSCVDIFDEPPLGGQDFIPPKFPTANDETVWCEQGRDNCSLTNTKPLFNHQFIQGDNYYHSGFFNGKFSDRLNLNLFEKNGTVRLYFNHLTLNNAEFGSDIENLIIYVKDTLTLIGRNEMEGILFIAGEVDSQLNANKYGMLEVEGGFATAGDINDIKDTIYYEYDVDDDEYDGYEEDDLHYADFEGIQCNIEPPPDPDLHHINLSYQVSALTCEPLVVEVSACGDASCNQLINKASVTLFRNPDSGYGRWTQHGNYSLTGNQLTLINGFAKVNLRQNISAPLNIGVRNDKFHCNGQLAGALGCSIAFENDQFIFDIPNKIAGKAVEVPFYARTSVSNNGQLSCRPMFQNQTKAINFELQYLQPSTGIKSVTLNGATIKQTTPINLQFDHQGRAKVKVDYLDAGRLAVNAQYIGRMDSEEAGLVISGQDQFTSRPNGFCVETIEPSACVEADTRCEVFSKAGAYFNLEITPVVWQQPQDGDLCDNAVTANFGLDEVPLIHQLISPATGKKGQLATSSYSHLANRMGTHKVAQAVDEVGVFQFGVADTTYFDMTIPASMSRNVGRFIPDRFKLASNKPVIVPSCNSFTYLDQPFTFQTGDNPRLELIPVAANEQVTHNYFIESWWRYDKQWLNRLYSHAGLDMVLTSVLSGSLLHTPPFVSLQNEQLKYIRQAQLVAPFSADFSLTLAALDLTDKDDVCYENDKGNCIGYVFTDISGSQLRYGRARLDNSYGRIDEVLRMPLYTEYVNQNGQWQRNREDICSQYRTDEKGLIIDLASAGLTQLAAYSDYTLQNKVANVVAGKGYIFYEPPYQDADVPVELQVPSWLKLFNGDGLINPNAMANFGHYRGHDRVIYYRESYGE